MRMVLDNARAGNLVTAYEPGRVQIRNSHHVASLIVSHDRLLTDWAPRRIEDLCAAHLEPVLELGPEILLLGTGERQRFPDPITFLSLIDSGIGYEVMDNAAACRTYNVLLAEQRPVTLALIMDGPAG